MPVDAGVLAPILAAKNRELESYRGPSRDGLARASHRFYAAIKRWPGQGLSVIAECKKASPSRGLIQADYRAVDSARRYRELGAKAISVLTDRDFFQGSLQDLSDVVSLGLPVLRKDFVIDERQILEARQAGAEAVLLIVRILDPFQLKDFSDLATDLGMDVLVEIHDEPELETALAVGSRIIGINHRNLDNLQMDLSLTERLAPLARRANAELLLVAESGVESRIGRERVEPFVDAVLVGTALMEAQDVEARWQEIFE